MYVMNSMWVIAFKMNRICQSFNRLYSKLDEIRLYLNLHYPVSVNICSETFLSSILDHQTSIEGYTITRRDRISKEGGGLIVYMKKMILNVFASKIQNTISQKLFG